MGLKTPGAVLHTFGDISFEELRRLACAVMESTGGGRTTPVVDIDASWLGYHCGTKSAGSVGNVIAVALAFANVGFHACLVGDNRKERHHSKRASNERAGKREKARIDAIVKRVELNHTVNALNNDDVRGEERENLEAKKKKLESSIGTCESKSKKSICEDFEARIEDAVEKLKLNPSAFGDRGGSVSYMEAEYQADSCMAKRRKDGLNDLIFSADSDFAAMVDCACFVIKTYQKETLTNERTKEKIATLSKFGVYSATAADLDGVIHSAGLVGTESRREAAPIPIFDACPSFRMRALAAVGIGCDQHPKGAKGFGAATILKEMNSLKAKKDGADLEKAFARWIGNVSGTSETIISTLADALVYEPANAVGEERSYINGEPPAMLDRYLRAFASTCTTVTDRCTLVECPGPCPGQSHLFLEGEVKDKFVCSDCAVKVCRFCVAHWAGGDSTEVQQYCLPCYSINAVLPGGAINTGVTVMQMREELKAAPTAPSVPASLGALEVEDLYVEHILSEKLNMFDSSKVKFPVLPSKELPSATDSADEGERSIKCCARFDFTNGGRFLRDENLTPANVADLIILLSDLLVLSDAEMDKKYQQDLVKVLPKLIVNFAMGSRLDGAWRLLYRCIRHALDARNPSLLDALGAVIEHDGNIGLLIEGKVRASMKGKTYKGGVAFTRDSLLACSCECKSGSQGCERITCVHVAPKIYGLHLLLIDGLADHMLYELAARWKQEDDGNIDEGRAQQMMDALLRLVSVAGLDKKLLDLEKAKLSSVSGILSPFTVGTENRKFAPPPPDPLKLGPFRLLKDRLKGLVSGAGEAAEKLTKKVKKSHSDAASAAEMARRDAARIAAGYTPPTRPPPVGAVAGRSAVPRGHNNDGDGLSSAPAASVGAEALLEETDPMERAPGQNADGDGSPAAATSPPDTLLSPEEIARRERARAAAGYTPPPRLAAPNTPTAGGEREANAETQSSKFDPDYDMVWAMIDATASLYPAKNAPRELLDCIGYMLVDLRRTIKNGRVMKTLVHSVKGQLRNLQRESMHRSHPTRKASLAPLDSSRNKRAGSVKARNDSSKKRQSTGEDRQREKGSQSRRNCYAVGCNCSIQANDDETRVPYLPEPLEKNASDKVKQAHAVQKLHRSEFLDRIGRSRRDKATEKRICGKHPFVTVVKYAYYLSSSGKIRSVRVEMRVPDNDGAKALSNLRPNAPSRGIASDRMSLNVLEDIKEQIDGEGDEAELAKLWKVIQQLSEIAEDEDISLINESVRIGFELDVHDDAVQEPACGSDGKRRRKVARKTALLPIPLKKKSSKKRKQRSSEHKSADPVVSLDISDDEADRLTGFPSLQMLLAYIAMEHRKIQRCWI